MGKEIFEKTYSVNETAKILKVNPMTVRRKIADRSLAHYRLGGKIEVGDSHLREYVQAAEVRATATEVK